MIDEAQEYQRPDEGGAPAADYACEVPGCEGRAFESLAGLRMHYTRVHDPVAQKRRAKTLRKRKAEYAAAQAERDAREAARRSEADQRAARESAARSNGHGAIVPAEVVPARAPRRAAGQTWHELEGFRLLTDGDGSVWIAERVR